MFFSTYYQIGVFKIIKFCKDITCFKWSTQKDILLVTIDDSIFYIITKDYKNVEKNFNELLNILDELFDKKVNEKEVLPVSKKYLDNMMLSDVKKKEKLFI